MTQLLRVYPYLIVPNIALLFYCLFICNLKLLFNSVSQMQIFTAMWAGRITLHLVKVCFHKINL